ncbi:MAG: acyltransferase family protein [Mitsuaria chitosanitabida]|uniref:acyltransferase family protein n=1 Tax=Roseateles chitosanitabidus TaxID=65048 RepID=UPI001B2ACA81|nr:acyltransferase family protein [Roseateles chitosanitabidus]MBO9688103.1 acyltransferase family protein [Roseateles chitosanitabidus]
MDTTLPSSSPAARTGASLPAPAAGTNAAIGRPASRLTELDWLRVIAFGLLILYHSGMFYVSWDWHVKSPRLIPALEGWMLWLNPWRMSLLFVISGAATALMLGRPPARDGTEAPNAPVGAGLGRLLATRSRRLLLPLVFGMAVVVPPQSYLEVVEKLHYAGSYLDFLKLYFQAYHGFCRGDDCLTLPTWNHLWFLPYLWAYTAVVLLACLASRRWMTHPGWGQVVRGGRLLWVPWLLFAIARQHLLDRFPTTHDLTHDWYQHAVYGAMFVLGVVLFGSREDRHGAWEAARRWRWVALVGFIVVQLLSQGLTAGWQAAHGEHFSDWFLMAMRALNAGKQWLPIVAALGWGRQLLADRDSVLLRWLTVAVFPFYIVHQTATVIAGHLLAPLQLPLAVEATALVAITAAACLIGAELATRLPLLRPWMGLGPLKTARTKPSPTAVATAPGT